MVEVEEVVEKRGRGRWCRERLVEVVEKGGGEGGVVF